MILHNSRNLSESQASIPLLPSGEKHIIPAAVLNGPIAKFVGSQFGQCSFSCSDSPSVATSERQRQKAVAIKSFFIIKKRLLYQCFFKYSNCFLAPLWPFAAAFLYHSEARALFFLTISLTFAGSFSYWSATFSLKR